MIFPQVKRQNFRATYLKELAAAALEQFSSCFASAQEDKPARANVSTDKVSW